MILRSIFGQMTLIHDIKTVQWHTVRYTNVRLSFSPLCSLCKNVFDATSGMQEGARALSIFSAGNFSSQLQIKNR